MVQDTGNILQTAAPGTVLHTYVRLHMPLTAAPQTLKVPVW